MPSWRDKFRIWERESVLKVERSELAAQQVAAQFPPWKRKIIAATLIAIIPVYFLVRYGAEWAVVWSHSKSQLQSHPSYAGAKPVRFDPVTVLPVGAGRWAAYTQIFNDNLDLSASNISYRFDFKNSAGDNIISSSGKLFLLPNEKKYLVVPRIDSSSVASGQVTFSGELWQKRIQIPQINLRPDLPALSNEVQPAGLAAEGVVFNDSPYSLGSVHITVLLYNSAGRIIAVNSRDEFSLRPGERRAYKLTWPGLSKAQVARAAIQAETNLLDASNLRPSK